MRDYEAASEDNECTISLDDAIVKSADFLYKLGVTDVYLADSYNLSWEYLSDKRSDVGARCDGYEMQFVYAPDKEQIYQPETFGIKTILDNNDQFYYAARELMNVQANGDYIISLEYNNPFIQTNVADANAGLITWEQALEKVQSELPAYFQKKYNPETSTYTEVCFNDVRLTYFRTFDGETVRVIPVYAFMQNEFDEEALAAGEIDNFNSTWPIQIYMINAMDGSFVDVMQGGTLGK